MWRAAALKRRHRDSVGSREIYGPPRRAAHAEWSGSHISRSRSWIRACPPMCSRSSASNVSRLSLLPTYLIRELTSPMTKGLKLGICALAVALESASANITFDLRATGPQAFNDGKCVFPTGSVFSVRLELWAQVTNAAPVNNIFGVQTVLGTIVSSNAPGATGSVGLMVFPFVFNSVAVAGSQNEISVPPDTILDLGTSSTASTTGKPKARKDPTTGGEALPSDPTLFYATNNQPAGATVHVITNGYEFLMGETTLVITGSSFTSFGALLNWKIPGFTTAALKGQIARWTDGDGQNNDGSAQFAEMSVGEPVNIICVPEPTVFDILLFGWLCLVSRRSRPEACARC